MKLLSEIAGGAGGRDSDVVKLARRRLANFTPVSDEFELFRLREFEARCSDAVMKSECQKQIAVLTLVKLNQNENGLTRMAANGRELGPEKAGF